MYCIDCGAQIPKNSKFCSHCGKQQNEEHPLVKKKNTETEVIEEVANENKQSLGYQFLQKSMVYYLIWLVLHFGILLIASDGPFNTYNMGARKFWPFDNCWGCGIHIYEITEFLVYTISPLIILVIISLIINQNNKNIE